jgi:hypothetical protein
MLLLLLLLLLITTVWIVYITRTGQESQNPTLFNSLATCAPVQQAMLAINT